MTMVIPEHSPEELRAIHAEIDAVLTGTRVALTARSMMPLRYMLEAPSGCDAWVTEKFFVVQYAWRPWSHDEYFLDIAPPILSFLLAAAPPSPGERGWELPSGRMPELFVRSAIHEEPLAFPAWSYGARAVWLVARDPLMFRIRAAADFDLGVPPARLEQRVEHVPATWPCPKCGRSPESYLELHDGSLVCLKCGVSSTSRPSP